MFLLSGFTLPFVYCRERPCVSLLLSLLCHVYSATFPAGSLVGTMSRLPWVVEALGAVQSELIGREQVCVLSLENADLYSRTASVWSLPVVCGRGRS